MKKRDCLKDKRQVRKRRGERVGIILKESGLKNKNLSEDKWEDGT